MVSFLRLCIRGYLQKNIWHGSHELMNVCMCGVARRSGVACRGVQSLQQAPAYMSLTGLTAES